MTVPTIAPIDSASLLAIAPPSLDTSSTVNFAAMLSQGLQKVNESLSVADATLQAVASGEPIAPHQAMLAMDQAKMDLHLALQVRSRLLEGFQELMRMQL